jgi:16S rRNA (guanine966-N2)-methyltransferase
MLRVIAGRFKGRKLRTIDSSATRPMTDRVRESLFSILAPELPGAHFLDLFAGSGAVGIEALSRGAAAALFVERDGECFDMIVRNLDSLGLESRNMVKRMDSYKAARDLGAAGRRFDIVFAGPPYDEDHHNRILRAIIENRLCKDEGIIVLQYRKGDPLHSPDGYQAEIRNYGITCLSFLRRGDA